MNSFTLVCVALVSGVIGAGLANHDKPAQTDRADRIVAVLSSGETTIAKRPPKIQERVTEFQCPPGRRDVMGQDGSIVECQARQ